MRFCSCRVPGSDVDPPAVFVKLLVSLMIGVVTPSFTADPGCKDAMCGLTRFIQLDVSGILLESPALLVEVIHPLSSDAVCPLTDASFGIAGRFCLMGVVDIALVFNPPDLHPAVFVDVGVAGLVRHHAVSGCLCLRDHAGDQQCKHNGQKHADKKCESSFQFSVHLSMFLHVESTNSHCSRLNGTSPNSSPLTPATITVP